MAKNVLLAGMGPQKDLAVHMKKVMFLLAGLVLAGCAGTGSPVKNTESQEKAAVKADEGSGAQPQVVIDNRPKGAVSVSLTNVVNQPLDGRVDLLSLEGAANRSFDVLKGAANSAQPEGEYRAYVHVLEGGVPVLVEVRDLSLKAGKTETIAVNLLEGASGAVPLRAFDSDGDLAIDRVEMAAGTDEKDPASMPGRATLPADMRTLRKGAAWYRGDLHAYSNHGTGTESVSALVGRAEASGLDFLAITDRNTLAALKDPGFTSQKTLLIPAMEWGDDQMGVALVYGPRTQPDLPGSIPSAQAECVRIQAQGGIWAVAHPCFPSKPWQWGLSYVNAVEIWFREWRETPPLALQALREEVKIRKDGGLVHSIAAAAGAYNQGDMSANAQSALFWDYELNRGLMACAIAGSGSGSKKVPLGRPVTYIHARDLSVPALLEGLRLGRTCVSCDINGPELFFAADVTGDGTMDVGIGGVVPLNSDVAFVAGVKRALGKKLQVLENGRPIRTVPINAEDTAIRFIRRPSVYSSYRLRVIGPADPKEKGFGPIQVYAVSSPIYAQDITQELLWRNPNFDPSKTWVRIKSDNMQEVELPENQPPAELKPL